MEKIIVATNNKGKLKEIKEILNNQELIGLNEVGYNIEVIEDGKTFEENSLKKAKEISEVTCLPCVADDSGLCIDELNGWPGVVTARFFGKEVSDSERNMEIINRMNDLKDEKRIARFKCVITYYYKGKIIVGKGEIVGKIAKEPRGKNGFGFDEIFELEDCRTLAELSDKEKNSLSARKLALENLKKQL